MILLSFCLTAFVLSIAAQALLWRIWLPRNHTAALLVLFGAACILFTVLLALLPDAAAGSMRGLARKNAIAVFVLFYVPMALTYVSFYSLLQYDSPSLTIVSTAAGSPAHCCTEDDLAKLFARRDLVAERLTAATKGGLVFFDGNTYRLTATGMVIARVFSFAARLLNLGKAG